MIALNDIGGIKVDEGSGFVAMGIMRARIGDAWVPVWSDAGPLSVTVPDTAYGARMSGSTIAVTSNSVTAEAIGGADGFTYLWTRTDGGGGTWVISASTAATTTFATNVAPETTEAATFKCTVTDAAATTADSADVYVELTNYGGGIIP